MSGADFSRSRMRVARSSAFNIPLITIALVFWVLIRSDAERVASVIVILVFGSFLSWLAIFAYKHLRIAYYQSLLMVDSQRAGVQDQ